MSAGTASVWLVGLDSGKITGTGVRAAISRIAVSVKVPAVPVVPIRMVGATCRITASRHGYRTASSRPCGEDHPPRADRLGPNGPIHPQ
jgi:hypothetical protein